MRKIVLLIFAALLAASQAYGQQTQITGAVTSDDGQPLIGVAVVVKGTNTGVVTGIEGRYTISAPANGTLIFSFLGLDSQEIAIDGRNTIDVVMSQGSTAIGGVVVTAMGVSREKKTLGYSASVISGDEIANSQAINPMSALQGKVAGMDISSAPGPGATQNVVIRGFSSFGNNQPLYIVDGVPITNEQNRLTTDSPLNSQVDFGTGINALNPNDIAETTVLKGAAATALYGSRAANGVIMITTKSGKNTDGKAIVSYDGSVNLTRVAFLPKEQDMFGQGWSGAVGLDENGNWGPAFDGKDRVWGNVVDGQQQYKPYRYLKDRIRDFYDLGVGFKNSLGVSGGTEMTQYHISASQNHVDGIVPSNKDTYDRYTIGVNGSHKTKRLTLSSNLNFSTEKNKSIPSGQGTSLYRSINEIATDISIVDLKDYNNKFNNLDNYFTPYGVNPYWVIDNNRAIQDKNKFFGKAQLDYSILDNLKLTYRFGGDYESSRSEQWNAKIEFTPGSPNYGSASGTPGDYEERRFERVQMNHDFIVNYNTRFNDFSLNAIAGGNINERQWSRLFGSISSIDIPGFYDLSNSLTPATSEQQKEKRRIVGLYVSADLGYKDYAYLTLTARNDWSSTLPKDDRSFFYPGATFSFLVTDFLRNQGRDTGVLDFAKVRVAYGQTGNDTEPYFVYDRYVKGFVTNPGFPNINNLEFPIGGVNSYTVSDRLGNPNLEPEITKEFEIGFEANFFGNRLGIDFSYYNRLTEGLIELLDIDPSSGYRAQMANLGDVRNKGIEVMLTGTPLKIGDFRWDVSYNVSRNWNKVEKLSAPEILIDGFTGVSIHAVEGKPMGQFKSSKAATTSASDVIYDSEGNAYSQAGMTIVDGSGNPVATTNTEYLGKDVNEKYRMGLTNTFSWKGISLSATLDFRYGGYIYSYTKDYMHWVGSSPESIHNDRRAFLIPNSVVQNTDGTYSENSIPVDPTALHTFYSEGGFQRDDYAVIDRSYLKLRDLSLSYQLPKSFCEKLRVSGIRVSANASNILLWTPKENAYIDPENTTFGNDLGAKFGEFGANPTNQYYTFSIGLTF